MALGEVRDGAAGRAHRRRCRKSLAVREKRSTFSLAPTRRRGRRRARRSTGFLLAGDWIDTGLPATIESAVMSGHLAALRHAATVAREIANLRADRIDAVLVHYSESRSRARTARGSSAGWCATFTARWPACTSRKCARRSAASRSCSARTTALPEVRDRLSRIFGIANYSVATRVPLDFDGMADAIVSQLPPQESVEAAFACSCAAPIRSSRRRRPSWRAISARGSGRRAAGRSISITPIS